MRIMNQFWEMPGKECDEAATQLMISENNFNRPEKRFQRLLKEAIELKDGIIDDIQLRAVYNYYDDFYMKDTFLIIDGKPFVSQVFKNVDPSYVIGAYVFVLTAGDFSYEDRPMMEQILFDAWGTSFAGTARRKLQEYFSKDGRISEVFGPGLYGIPMESMTELVSLVDADKIGVTVNDSCFLWPVKSYGGIYLRVADDYKPIGADCVTCRGSKLSCHLCEYNPHNRQPAAQAAE